MMEENKMRTRQLSKKEKLSIEEKEYAVLQKIAGAIIFVLGLVTIPLADGDGTAFVFLLLFAVPLLLSKDKLKYYERKENDE